MSKPKKHLHVRIDKDVAPLVLESAKRNRRSASKEATAALATHYLPTNKTIGQLREIPR